MGNAKQDKGGKKNKRTNKNEQNKMKNPQGKVNVLFSAQTVFPFLY